MASIEARQKEEKKKERERELEEKRRKLADMQLQKQRLQKTHDEKVVAPEPVAVTLAQITQQVQDLAAADKPEEVVHPTRKVNLTATETLILVDIPPSTRGEIYDKICQTDEVSAPLDDDAVGSVMSPKATVTEKRRAVSSEREQSLHEVEEIKSEHQTELSSQAKKEILARPDFQSFLSRASWVMERALNVNVPIVLADVTECTGQDQSQGRQSGQMISLRHKFSDERWSKNKPVTSLTFDAHRDELFVASYLSAPGPGSLRSKYGSSVALVWSVNVSSRCMEHYLSPSDICNAFYDRNQPLLLIGSCYNGQLIIWDSRTGPEPVAKSPLSSETHTHPVFGLSTISGTSNNIISLSTDGRLCVWNPQNLSMPQESSDLTQSVNVAETEVKKPITSCTLAISPCELSKFYVGAEDGGLYAGNRLGGNGGIVARMEGHNGPITSTRCHPLSSNFSACPSEVTDLILTSSMDWSCKLWRPGSTKPLCSFDEYTEYVYDAAWSPTHPALFGSVDGKGDLVLWNCANSLEIPAASINATGGRAVNKLTWLNDGHGVLVGDGKGEVSLYDVATELCVPNPDDGAKFLERLKQLDAY